MVDSEGNCVSFNFPSAAEGRVSLMSAAKAARRPVQSERPGLTAGAFAFGGVRTPFCDKGLRARRSLGVGQRGGVAECLADPRGRARGLSLRASRVLAHRKVSGSRSEAEMHELTSHRGASGEIWTARRPRNTEVSGDESR